jgi:hypothetical protein
MRSPKGGIPGYFGTETGPRKTPKPSEKANGSGASEKGERTPRNSRNSVSKMTSLGVNAGSDALGQNNKDLEDVKSQIKEHQPRLAGLLMAIVSRVVQVRGRLLSTVSFSSIFPKNSGEQQGK